MSTFQQEIEITLDGEVFKCRSKAIDFTNAERQLTRDGGEVQKDQMGLRFRIAYCVFRRNYPDHPAARAFGIFLDVLDDIQEESTLDIDDDDGDLMDPSPAVGLDTSP